MHAFNDCVSRDDEAVPGPWREKRRIILQTEGTLFTPCQGSKIPLNQVEFTRER